MFDASRRARRRPADPPASPGLDVALSFPEPDTVLAEVRGELDTATAPRLYAQVVAAFTAGVHELVVVDLSQVRFFDAAGISSLLMIRAHARERGAEVRVVAAGRPVLRLLSIVDLVRTLDVHPTRAAALTRRRATCPRPEDRRPP